MSGESLLVILLVGLIAGWLAGQIVQGTGFGLVADLCIGIIGAFIGDWLLPRLGIHLGTGILAAIIAATVGAVVLLVILGLVARRGRWRVSMPILRLLEEYHAFGPNEIRVVSAAFEDALRELRLVGRTDPLTEMVAERIIRAGYSASDVFPIFGYVTTSSFQRRRLAPASPRPRNDRRVTEETDLFRCLIRDRYPAGFLSCRS